jgi:methylglutaconyl-CoA hydratase
MMISVSYPRQGVASVALNRANKRNALNALLIEELTTALKELAINENVRVVLLAGEGPDFCAGADIAAMQKQATLSHKENLEDATQLALLLYTLYIFPKPTIAVVQGATLGGGLGLLACCDIAIAAEDASFCFSEVKMGLTPSVVSPYVVAMLGERCARYYFLTARRFFSEEAERIGLIHARVPSDQLMEKAIECAEQLLKNSPYALSEVKKLISHVSTEKISAELLHFTAEHLSHMRSTEEAREGLSAFLEKRMPKWE